jgi:uncharacterized membrane protein
MKTSDLVVKAALLGAGGWAIENALSKEPRYSALFKGQRVPWLPVYAFGGAAVMMLAPRLREKELPCVARAAIYAVALSAIEYAGCWTDREVLGACSWDYSQEHCAKPSRGCVDFKHAALWGMLGLLAEKL